MSRLTQQRYYLFHYVALFLLTLVGIADSIYLSITHYRNHTDITYSSFCALSKAINCDTVSQSSWSLFLGLPISYWGLLGYLLFLLFLIPARRNTEERLSLFSFLFLFGACSSIIAIILGYVSATKIHAYCIMCLLSYGVSFLLFYLSWRMQYRFNRKPLFESIKIACQCIGSKKWFITGISTLVLSGTVLFVFLPEYWKYTFPPITENIKTGMTEDGSPWIGAENPQLVIEEYADYQCFQCGKMHAVLRRLVAEHPDTIRVIHHHYPMDHEYNQIVVPEAFHEGSGKMALLAIYASTRNKFWPMNDELYKLMQDKGRTEIDLKVLATKIGLNQEELQNSVAFPPFLNKLNYDIIQGMKLRIMGTPSYVINGDVFQSTIPKHYFETLSK